MAASVRHRLKQIFALLIVVCFLPAGAVRGQEVPANTTMQVAGEIFGMPVPLNNYLFVRSAIAVFGNKWGPQPANAEEFEDLVWEQLILSFEAFRRKIVVSKEEINNEITNVLRAQKLSFNFQKDKEAYRKWVQEKTQGGPPDFFENEVKHTLEIDKLRQQVIGGFIPQVTEDQIHETFLNEHTQLNIELLRCSSKEEAEVFYSKAKQDKNFWEEEKKKRPGDFKASGLVSLDSIAQDLGLSKDAVIKIRQMQAHEIGEDLTNDREYAVFKVQELKPAGESDFGSLRRSYYDKLNAKMKSEFFNQWLKRLKQQARIRIYKKGGVR